MKKNKIIWSVLKITQFTVFMMFIFLVYEMGAQTQRIKFKRLTTADGLSQNGVPTIIQDTKGLVKEHGMKMVFR